MYVKLKETSKRPFAPLIFCLNQLVLELGSFEDIAFNTFVICQDVLGYV